MRTTFAANRCSSWPSRCDERSLVDGREPPRASPRVLRACESLEPSRARRDLIYSSPETAHSRFRRIELVAAMTDLSTDGSLGTHCASTHPDLGSIRFKPDTSKYKTMSSMATNSLARSASQRFSGTQSCPRPRRSSPLSELLARSRTFPSRRPACVRRRAGSTSLR